MTLELDIGIIEVLKQTTPANKGKTMFKSYYAALDFFRSLESRKEIVEFVVKHHGELIDHEVVVAGKVLAEKC